MDLWICSIIEGYIYENVDKITRFGYREKYIGRYGKIKRDYKCWNKDGKLIIYDEGIYNNEGKLIKISYYSYGQLDFEKTLIENDIYEFKQYYDCAVKLLYKVIMKDNNWHGEFIRYWYCDEDEISRKKINIKTTYKNGNRDGEYKYWNEEGELIEHKIYKEGEVIQDLTLK